MLRLRSTTHGLWLFGVKPYRGRVPGLEAVIANSNSTELQDVYVYSARNPCAHLFSDGPNDKWAVMIILDDKLGDGGPVNEVFFIIWTRIGSLPKLVQIFFRASLRTLFFHEIFILPREIWENRNPLRLVWKPYFPKGFFIFPREISWEIENSMEKWVAKLALRKM